MSIIFHQITTQNNGTLPLDVGTGVPVGAVGSQGLLVNALGEVFATLDGPLASWQAGLPFDANGRLFVGTGPVVSYSGGLGFTASGALAVLDTRGGSVPTWYTFAILLVNFEQNNDPENVQDLSALDNTIDLQLINAPNPNTTLEIINTILGYGAKCSMMALSAGNGFNVNANLVVDTQQVGVAPMTVEFTVVPITLPVNDGVTQNYVLPMTTSRPNYFQLVYVNKTIDNVEDMHWFMSFGLPEPDYLLPPFALGVKTLVSIIWQATSRQVYLNGVLILNHTITFVSEGPCRAYLLADGQTTSPATVLLDDVIILNGYALRTGPFTPEPGGILQAAISQLPYLRDAGDMPLVYNQGVLQSGGVLSVTGLAAPATAPGRVVGVIATPDVQALQVTWNTVVASPPVDNYLLEWQATGSTVWSSLTTGPTQTGALITGLNANVVYKIRVTAHNASGYGPSSAEITAQPLFALPGPVLNIAATPAVQAAVITWSANPPGDDVLFYTVYWLGGGMTEYASINVPGTNYTITGLVGGAAYSIYVTATNAGGAGPFNTEVLVTPTIALPGQVTGLAVVSGVLQLSASWNPVTAVSPVTSYTIEWRVNGSGSWSSQNVGLATSYVITGLVGSQSYNLRVYATNSAGNGPYSSIVNGAPLPAPPSQVTGVTATAVIQAIDVTWVPVTSSPVVTNYNVQYKLSAGSNWTTIVLDNVTSTRIGGLTGGLSYDVQVQAVSTAGAGPYSTPVSASPLFQTPGQVTGLVLVPALNQITASWNAVTVTPPVGNYTVQWRLVGAGTWNSQTVGTALTLAITGLTGGSSYEVRVFATNLGGDGPASAISTAMAYALPGQVTGLILTPAIQSLILNWSAVTATPAVSGYTVDWRPVGSPTWASVAVGNVTTYNLASLAGGQAYEVAVYATNAAGDGPLSAIGTSTALYPLPGQVTGLVVTTGVTSLNTSWNAVTASPAVTGYTVQWRVNGTTPWNSSPNNVTTSYVITGLVGGTLYDVQVYATNLGGNGPTSSIATGTPYAAVGVVQNVAVVPGFSEATVSFNGLTAVPAITSYLIRYRLVGASTWITQTLASTGAPSYVYTVANLVPLASYEFTVAATNGVSTGADASAVTATPTARASNLVLYAIFNATKQQAFRTDVTPWTPIGVFGDLTGNEMLSCAYTYAQNRIAFGGNNPNKLQVYNTNTWPPTKLAGVVQPGGAVQTSNLTFSPDGTLLGAATSAGGASAIYTTADFTQAPKTLGTTADSSISFNALNTRAAVGSAAGGNGPLQIWDITGTPALLSPPPNSPTAQALSVAFHPNKNILAVNGTGAVLARIYNIDANTYLGVPPGLTGTTGYTLRFNNAGTRIAISTSNMFRVYNCTDLLNPTNWTNITITNPPSVTDDNNYSIEFTANDAFLLARDMTSPDKALAFDVSVTPIVRVADFDQVRASTYMEATALYAPSLPLLPGQVVGLVVTPATLGLNLIWNILPSSNPLTNYVIQYMAAGATYYTNIMSTTSNQYSITGLTAGVTYTVRIIAVNTGGWGVPSATATGVPTANTPPGQVTGANATSGNQQWTATWSAVTASPAVTGYSLEYRTYDTQIWTVVNVGNQLNYTLAGLTNGVQYVIRIQAQNSAGFGQYSTNVYITPLATPSAPTTWTAMTRNLASGSTGAETVRGYGFSSGAWMAIFAGGYASSSVNDGAAWNAATRYLNSGAAANTNGNQIRSDGGQVWVAVFDNGYAARSTNGAVTWTALPRGLGNASNPSFYQLNTDRNGVWIAAGSGGYASRSTDNGATWTALPQGLGMGANATIGGLGQNGQTHWVAYGDQQYASRSADRGATWTALTQGLGTGVITQSARGVVGLNNIFVAVTTSGYASRSTDWGVTWTALTRGLNTGLVTADLHIGSDRQSTIVCVASGGYASQSIDRGATWTVLTRGLNTGQTTLDFECVHGKGDNSGVFMSGQAQGYASRSTGASASANLPGVITASAGAIANAEVRTWPTVATAQINTPQLRIQNANANSITISINFNGSNYGNQIINPNQLATYNFSPIANGATPTLTITGASAGIVLGQIDLLSL